MAAASDWRGLRDARVLLEDEAVLALDKPAGLALVGGRHETDLVTLARDAGERLLPVHRIDKVTSGAVLLAKQPRARADLARQFSRRTVGKAYLAITRSTGLPGRGAIELPLSVGRKQRVRVAAPRDRIVADRAAGRWTVAAAEVRADTRTYPSLTTFARVWHDERHTLLVVRPATGRRHQIRVHLAWIGHPVEGDPLFPGPGAPAGGRTCLHSWRIAFDAAWSGGARTAVEAPPGADFWAPLRGRLPGGTPAAVLERARRALDEPF
jgi:tRNA pseudouridine32 synthase/23S rRNA pseudouridine746 synthase/23S rRNA pseudouridine1911/1915/1917 synthase